MHKGSRALPGRREHLRQVLNSTQRVLQVWFLETLLRQKPLPASRDGRHVPVVVEGPSLTDERTGHAYVPNTVHSSRYSLIDFFPRQLWFQSTRLHNLFFICIGVPQCISGLSTTGNFTTILPLLVFMFLTILKEGYDDYRRHRLDQVENKSLATALRSNSPSAARKVPIITQIRQHIPGLRPKPPCIVRELGSDGHLRWERVEWRNIIVGDILHLARDEPVPADVVILYADGDDGLCYIETMNLDGETNLKSRRSPPSLQQCHSIPGIRTCGAVISAEDPSPELHNFSGKVSIAGKTQALTLDNIILRGCVLRNTASAVALVVRTGEECSIRMNANRHSAAKKPRLEKFGNQAVVMLIIYVILITAGLSIGYMLWQHSTEHKSFYIEDAPVGYQQIIIGYGIMFNNVIPLALYVSLEIVRIGQMLLMNSDVELYDEASDTPMRCNTNTILENLGQVTHILSDKTGTLTENVMRFRKMSFAGTKWAFSAVAANKEESLDEIAKGDGSNGPQIVVTDANESGSDEDKPTRPSLSVRAPSFGNARDLDGSTDELMAIMKNNPRSAFADHARKLLLGLALCHTCLPEPRDGHIDYQAASPDEVALTRAARDLGFVMTERTSKTMTLIFKEGGAVGEREVYEILDTIEFSSGRKRMSIIVRCPDGKIWLICKGADSVLLPLLQQATVATEQAHSVRKSTEIERRRYRKSMQEYIRTSMGDRISSESNRQLFTDSKAPSYASRPVVPRAHSYEHRDPIARLRASLDVRPASLEISPAPFNRASLRVPHTPLNGSGTVPALVDSATIFRRCFEDIDQYANEGLRTLLFTHRSLPEHEYASWKKLYHDASTSIIDRQARIEATGQLIEQHLELLGVTAIEDKLQEGVPETIEKLTRVAKIFCLTGDKRETAISVAHSANICRPDSDIFILDSAKGDLDAQLQAFASELESGSVHSALVVDGRTLAMVEADSVLKEHFYALVAFIDSVICCRASPAQKANIVQGIRASMPDALTLAIGDGSNDIAMIQAAHVGVGISGKEGLQAYRAADYSIAQFRFLQRLLLVHGRWNYVRTSRFILLTFWKEMLFYLPQAVYQRYCGYTGSSLYESWSLTVLNTLFTSLCVVVPGIFEQDLKAETLLAVPELYAYGQLNKGLNMRLYLLWMVGAAATGIVIWFVCWAGFGVFDVAGATELFALGDLCFSAAIVWTNIKLFLIETHAKTIIVIVAFLITIAGWWLWNIFLSLAYDPWNFLPYEVRGGFIKHFGQDGSWWATLVLTCIILAVAEISPYIYRRLVASDGIRRLSSVLGPHRPKARSVEGEAVDVAMWQELEKDKLHSETWELREMTSAR